MDLPFIEHELRILKDQHRDAMQQAREWGNTALRIEGALAQMKKLRGLIPEAGDGRGDLNDLVRQDRESGKNQSSGDGPEVA